VWLGKHDRNQGKKLGSADLHLHEMRARLDAAARKELVVSPTAFIY